MGWTVRGSNPGGGEIFRTCPDRPTQLSVQFVPGFSGGVGDRLGVTPTPHPLLMPWSRKSTAIPLLPLWAVRPVQSLSASTRVHFTFNSMQRSWWNPKDHRDWTQVYSVVVTESWPGCLLCSIEWEDNVIYNFVAEWGRYILCTVITKYITDLVQNSGSNMAPSEIFIRDRGISVRVMS